MEPRYALLIECPDRPSQKMTCSAARMIVGRESGDIVLPDGQVSDTHAELLFDGQHVVLRDLGSMNGTWCKGRRVASLEYSVGLNVQLGQHRITFLGITGAAGRGPAVAPQRASLHWQLHADLTNSIRRYPLANPVSLKKGSRWFTVLFGVLGVVAFGVIGLGALEYFQKPGEPKPPASTVENNASSNLKPASERVVSRNTP